MKKPELISKVAREQGIETSMAADRMDRVVNQILRALKSGRAAHLPGLGTIRPGKRWVLDRESNER
ncbi:MAG TPA: HU family DNA-binding protein [Bryobacteraceae bacterium]|jgi:nucleoid DNA-binding protein|nr:HU family DNA-binding protein [Bryobacteraceae bacterium]